MNKKILIPIATLSTVGVMSVAFLSKTPELKSVDVRADNSITLDSEALQQATLSTLEVPDNRNKTVVMKEDRQFRIPLPNGKYVSGAVIFNDCGHQYIGNNLAEPFGINNDTDTGQAFNFHFVFSLQHIKSISIKFTGKMTTSSADTDAQNFYIRTKTKSFDPYFATEKAFHDHLQDEDNGGYINLLANDTANNYYDYVTHAWDVSEDKWSVGVNSSENTFTDNFNGNQYQLAVVQIQNESSLSIKKDRDFQFAIESITFDYYC